LFEEAWKPEISKAIDRPKSEKAQSAAQPGYNHKTKEIADT